MLGKRWMTSFCLVFLSGIHLALGLSSPIPAPGRIAAPTAAVIATSETLRSVSPASSFRIVRPLIEDGYVGEEEETTRVRKPMLLYLPGFDGTLLSPFIQFPEMSTSFDVCGLRIDMEDRSTFDDLSNAVCDFVRTHGAEEGVYLAGESFGGLLACETALRLQAAGEGSLLRGLTLINPATSYKGSALDQKAPHVADLPGPLYVLGLMSLLPLFLDRWQLPQMLKIVSSEALPSVIDTPAREAYMGRVAFTLGSRLKMMPQATLRWRLEEWLTKGSAAVNEPGRVEEGLATCETLVVAAEMDATLPSYAEASRLAALLPRSEAFVVDGAGHTSTCGSRIDLTALLRRRFFARQPMVDDAGSSAGVCGADEEVGENSNTRGKYGRISMKPEASKGKGTADYGMEKRTYPSVSPMDYWDSKFYRAPASVSSTSTSEGARL